MVSWVASRACGERLVSTAATALMYAGWSIGPQAGYSWRDEQRVTWMPGDASRARRAALSVAWRSPRLPPRPINAAAGEDPMVVGNSVWRA